MKELAASVFHSLGLALWVEITTENPKCVYYFGPFVSQTEAQKASEGYVEDLRVEGAQDIHIEIKRCKPAALTIFEEGKLPRNSLKSIPTLSGQTF